MKRSQMVNKLQTFYAIRHPMLEEKYITLEQFMDELLLYVEEKGVRPPRLPEETCQAVMSIYYGGYSLNQWEEEVEKDDKVTQALERRRRWKQETPSERRARRRNR